MARASPVVLSHVSDLEALCRDLDQVVRPLPSLTSTLQQRARRLRSLAAEIQLAAQAAQGGPNCGRVVEGLYEAASATENAAESLIRAARLGRGFIERTVAGGSPAGVVLGSAGEATSSPSDGPSATALGPQDPNAGEARSKVTKADLDRAASVNREVQAGQRKNGFIDANDEAGGHIRRKHIGRDITFLTRRAGRMSRGQASTFFDDSHAERAISEALSDPVCSAAIDHWLASGGARHPVDKAVSEVAGIVVDKAGGVRSSSRVLVMLIRVDGGYRLNTAYVD